MESSLSPPHVALKKMVNSTVKGGGAELVRESESIRKRKLQTLSEKIDLLASAAANQCGFLFRLSSLAVFFMTRCDYIAPSNP